MTIIAYTYDGDYHCLSCAAGHEQDEETNPVFSTDEWIEPSQDGRQVLACGDCGDEIDTYWSPLLNDEMWDKLHEMGVSEEALTLITSINGYNEETFEAVLFSRFGYRSFEQLESE